MVTTRPSRPPALGAPGWPSPRPGPVTDEPEAGGALRRMILAGGPRIVFQPQLSLSRLEIVGYEALSRFPDEPDRTPEQWFRLAHQVGLGAAIEACALANALQSLDTLPAGCVLAVNVSPSVLGSPALHAVLPHDLTGIEIELTEHEAVADGDGLRRELDRLRGRGARLAIDDVGAGHSGLSRMMQLAPDTLKLDARLVGGVAGNTAQAALIRAVVDLADHLDAVVCAEGVETLDDALALADLDVDLAQGWAVAEPGPGFAAADPRLVAACGLSMRRALNVRPPITLPGTGREPATLEDLLGELTDVRDLDGLAALARAGTRVLACDQAELSFLHPGGDAVEALVGEKGPGDGRRYRLGDFPATRACLGRGIVTPVYDEPGGDPAERRLLAEGGFSSVLLVPVSSRGRPVGLLECYLLERSPWSRRQIRSARLLASVLGPVLDGLLMARR